MWYTNIKKYIFESFLLKLKFVMMLPELHSKESRKYLTGYTSNLESPMTLAGAFWYNTWDKAYLYSVGPTDTPVIIKV